LRRKPWNSRRRKCNLRNGKHSVESTVRSKHWRRTFRVILRFVAGLASTLASRAVGRPTRSALAWLRLRDTPASRKRRGARSGVASLQSGAFSHSTLASAAIGPAHSARSAPRTKSGGDARSRAARQRETSAAASDARDGDGELALAGTPSLAYVCFSRPKWRSEGGRQPRAPSRNLCESTSYDRYVITAVSRSQQVFFSRFCCIYSLFPPIFPSKRAIWRRPWRNLFPVVASETSLSRNTSSCVKCFCLGVYSSLASVSIPIFARRYFISSYRGGSTRLGCYTLPMIPDFFSLKK